VTSVDYDQSAIDALDAPARRALGAVYTPNAEVRLAVELACDHWVGRRPRRILETARVVDPACGAGAFLAGYRRVAPAPALLVGVDADANAATLAQQRVPDAQVFHADALVTDPARFVWGRHAPARYDLVIGNPPYVRHQALSDPLGRTGRYAEAVAATIRQLAPTLVLSRRADLAAAFLVLGTTLLAPGGVMAFVTTSAWLDAAYGVTLGRYLLDAGLVELAERPAERTFQAADVNSLIVIVRRGHTGPVTLRRVGADTRRIARDAMRHEPKWGGRLLRAPREAGLLDAALADADSLGASHRVGGYLVTGADRFFYLDAPAAAALDQSCLRPVVKSTRGKTRIVLGDEPDRYLFSCEDPARFAARDDATAAWLRHGVADGVPTRSGVRGRRVWCAISQEPAPILVVRTMRDRHVVYLNPAGRASGEFYRVWPAAGVPIIALAAFLSCSIVGLQLEGLGRAYGGGGGPLKVERSDLVRVRLPDAKTLTANATRLARAFAPLLTRSVTTVTAERERGDRRALERVCGALVGLSDAATDTVCDAYAACVAARVDRAARVLAAG
jgi:SAM-dependent methyltransferase